MQSSTHSKGTTRNRGCVDATACDIVSRVSRESSTQPMQTNVSAWVAVSVASPTGRIWMPDSPTRMISFVISGSIRAALPVELELLNFIQSNSHKTVANSDATTSDLMAASKL